MWSPGTQKKSNLKLNCDLQIKSDKIEEKSNEQTKEQFSTKASDEDQTSPVWQPFGAPYCQQFRPVKLEVKTTTTRTTIAVPQVITLLHSQISLKDAIRSGLIAFD